MPDHANLRDAAIRELWLGDATASEPSLYAVIDAARDKAIYPRLHSLARAGAEVLPLYQGKALAEMASVSPYLVGLGHDKSIFDWLWQEGWGNAWCIYLWSLVSIDTMREHLRRHTKARTESGEMLVFRFYDPRVMRQIMPVLEPAQRLDLIGPISRITVEAEDGTGVIHYINTGRAVSETRKPLRV